MSEDIAYKNAQTIVAAFADYELTVEANLSSPLQPFPKVEEKLGRALRENELVLKLNLPSGRVDVTHMKNVVAAINQAITEVAGLPEPDRKPKVLCEDRLKAAVFLRFSLAVSEMPELDRDEFLRVVGEKFVQHYNAPVNMKWAWPEQHPRVAQPSEGSLTAASR